VGTAAAANRAVNDDSFSDSETNDSLQPASICTVTRSLLLRLTNGDLEGAVSLDLHLRDRTLGKIRQLQNLHLVPNVQFLNASYNAVIKMSGFDSIMNLIELNLAENSIEKVNLYSTVLLTRLP
jgi:hypothetical protein